MSLNPSAMAHVESYKRGILIAALGMVILSPDGLLLRLVEDASIWTVIFYRTTFMGLSLCLYLAFLHRSKLVQYFRHMGRAGVLSMILLATANPGFVGAIFNTSVANVLVILATLPLFGAVLGWFIIGEAVTPRTWVSILCAIVGIGIIFSGSIGGGYWVGDLLAAGTAFLQGLNLVVIRKAKERDILLPALCLSGFLAGLVVLPMAEPLTITGHDLAVLSILGLVIAPLALGLFLNGARHAPAAEVGLLALIETVLGPLWAWIGVGEEPATLSLIGGAVVIVAVGFNSWLGMRRSRR
ncbi:MAG: EamA family transporter [Rhodospirillaceae bacterium]|nr:EamA family transporter [Rhodospirillaceae bacterium]